MAFLGACSHAYGRGVKADGARAWKELEDVIKHSDTENSTYAIVLAIEAWKDGKVTLRLDLATKIRADWVPCK